MRIEEKEKTAKCPDCGNKYLVKTSYCVTCKKKVKKEKNKDKKKEEIHTLSDTLRLPGTDILLEVGDSFQIIKDD